MTIYYKSIKKPKDKYARCQYEYMPDEDGYIDECGSRTDLFECDGLVLCPIHRDGTQEEWDRLRKMLWVL